MLEDEKEIFSENLCPTVLRCWLNESGINITNTGVVCKDQIVGMKNFRFEQEVANGTSFFCFLDIDECYVVTGMCRLRIKYRALILELALN